MHRFRLNRLRIPAIVLIVLTVPVFLITTNLGVVINSGWLYTYGFNQYDISQRTGIEKQELTRVAKEIKHYFASSEEPLAVRAVVYGEERDLFTEREVLHMADVKGLVRGVGLFQMVSIFTMFGAALSLILLAPRRTALSAIGTGLFGGSMLTFGIMIALGLGSLAGFERLFEQFHFISFSNDLWRLSSRDYLILIFPEEFYRDATLIIAGLTLGQAALTAISVMLVRRVTNRTAGSAHAQHPYARRHRSAGGLRRGDGWWRFLG